MFYKKIKELWVAETPKIWKWVRNMAATVGAVATAVLAAESAAGINVTDGSKKLLAYGIAIGAAVAAIAQLHKSDESK